MVIYTYCTIFQLQVHKLTNGADKENCFLLSNVHMSTAANYAENCH